MRHIERRRVTPGHTGPRRLVAQHGEVEADVLTDDHPAREHLRQRLEQLGKLRRARDPGVGDSMNPGGRGGDRNPRIDAGVDARLVRDDGSAHCHRTDLDDAVARHIESGSFQIERDRGQGRERVMTR